jgi:hypothetical protein
MSCAESGVIKGEHMAENLEKSKEQTVPFIVETPVASPIAVGKVNSKDEEIDDSDDDVVELDLDEQDDDDSEDEELAEILDDGEDDSQESEPLKADEQKAKPSTKQDRKIQALKNQALKLQGEKVELERKLAEKKEVEKKVELVKKYVDKGLDESDAEERAERDIEQDTIKKQLAVLMFEKQNRRFLEKYPQADSDIDRIMSAVKNSGMTVEQVCRGLYGTEVPESEKRAIAALTDTGTQPEQKGTIANAMKSATTPQRSKLTQQQLDLKRYLEKKYKLTKPMTDDEAITYWNASRSQ